MGISVAEAIRRLSRITEQELQEETRKIIQRDPKLIEAKVNEFKRGENPDGSRIGFYRNPAYRNLKRSFNPEAGGTVDLIFTGSFTNQLFVQSEGNRKFIFDSYDEKRDLLGSKYGNQIFGINQNTFNERQKAYGVDLVKYIKEITGLK